MHVWSDVCQERAVAASDAPRFLRQASEQTFTSSQFFAHFFRQVIGRPQTAQGLEGSDCLLPLNERVARLMPHCSAMAAGLGSGESGRRG